MASRTQKHSLLIVEDTPIDMRNLVRILQPDYNIIVATSGKKALELVERHQVDLILLDIVLADMSGFEVLRSLKKSKHVFNIPVIFVTATESAENEVAALSEGAVDFIAKPFKDEVVLLRVGTQMKILNQLRLLEQSTKIDSLTGASNRHAFNLDIYREWKFAIESGQCISLIMIDIDNFKAFNDTYGHLGGDQCLIAVANTLKANVAETVYRWGGEEFAVLLPNTPMPTAEIISERLRKNIANNAVEYKKGHPVSVTISLGVGTTYPAQDGNLPIFCDEVDKALYLAKQNGKNRVEAVLL